jgi:hypothetical protein
MDPRAVNGVSFPYSPAQHSSAPSGLSIQHVRFGCGLPRYASARNSFFWEGFGCGCAALCFFAAKSTAGITFTAVA